jgi:hypothetical protein
MHGYRCEHRCNCQPRRRGQQWCGQERAGLELVHVRHPVPSPGWTLRTRCGQWSGQGCVEARRTAPSCACYPSPCWWHHPPRSGAAMHPYVMAPSLELLPWLLRVCFHEFVRGERRISRPSPPSPPSSVYWWQSPCKRPPFEALDPHKLPLVGNQRVASSKGVLSPGLPSAQRHPRGTPPLREMSPRPPPGWACSPCACDVMVALLARMAVGGGRTHVLLLVHLV